MVQVSFESIKNHDPLFYILRNLSTIEYSTNLCQYLDQSRNVSNLTNNDLRNVLTGHNGLNNQSENSNELTQPLDMNRIIPIKMTNIWYVCDSCSKWYIGVINELKDGKIVVSYMRKSDKR